MKLCEYLVTEKQISAPKREFKMTDVFGNEVEEEEEKEEEGLGLHFTKVVHAQHTPPAVNGEAIGWVE